MLLSTGFDYFLPLVCEAEGGQKIENTPQYSTIQFNSTTNYIFQNDSVFKQVGFIG